MTTVNLRSPFFITVNESGQVGSKIELFIWAFGGSVPATPNYTMAMPIPTATQLRNDYEVASKVRYSLDFERPIVVTTPANEETSNFAFFRVKRYKETSIGSYTLLDTTDYVGVDGYNLFTDGYNKTNSNTIQPLFNLDLIQTFKRGFIPYVNILFDHNGTDTIIAEYTKLNGTTAVTNNILTSSDASGVYLKKIPVTKSSTNYDEGNIVNIKVNGSVTQTFTFIPTEEARYTPVNVSFINRFGGWQNLTFFKVRKDNISVDGKDYVNLQQGVDYSIYKGQKASYNKNATQQTKLNTGFVDEVIDELIQDLLLSEVVLMDELPVLVKTNSVEKFRHITTKNINYQIDFEHAYSILNNVK